MARKPLRPLIRSGGFYPSRKWTPLVYAGGYTTANGGGEPEPPPIEKTITGNPIHILDALAKPVQALSVALEPIQDLHGYDNPWPAGGGKNKYPILIGEDQLYNNGGATHSNNNGNLVIITSADQGASGVYVGASSAIRAVIDTYDVPLTVSMDIVATASGDVRVVFCGTQVLFAIGTTKQRISVTATSNSTKNFNIYGVNNGATLTVSNVQIEAGSTATAFSPYENICPISGHTDADVTRTGVNLFDKTTITDNAYVNGQGQVMTGFTEFFCSDYISVKPKTAYYLFTDINGRMDTIRFFDANKAVIGGSAYQKRVVTTPANCYFVRINAIKSNISADELFFNYPATDTAYHAYVGTTYPIPLGTTVYGGHVDVVTGEVWATVKYKKPPKADIRRNQDTQFYVVADSEIAMGTEVPCISNKFRPWNGTESLYKKEYYCFVNSGGAIRFNTTAEYSTVDDVWDAIGEMEFVCQLATPVLVTTLTPTQVELLLGENNIWSDGEMTLVYLADGNASDIEALNILLGGRYVNNHEADEPTDREALDIVLGGKK